MSEKQLVDSLSLSSSSFDGILEGLRATIQNAISTTDADKILLEIKEEEMGNKLLDESKNHLIEVSKNSNDTLSYASKFLKSLVVEFAGSSNTILNGESTINQNIMSADILKTDNIMNTTASTVETESKGFFGRLWDRIKNAGKAVKDGIKAIVTGEGTVIQKVAQMLTLLLGNIFSIIAETFSPLIMTIASGFLHITSSVSTALNVDADTVFDKMIAAGQKLQGKLIEQKPVWENMPVAEEE